MVVHPASTHVLVWLRRAAWFHTGNFAEPIWHSATGPFCADVRANTPDLQAHTTMITLRDQWISKSGATTKFKCRAVTHNKQIGFCSQLQEQCDVPASSIVWGVCRMVL
jgi:uncharacterized protein YfaT (DUF1175 family)